MTKQKYTSSLQLPFLFDASKLKSDTDIILKEAWKPHFNTTGYEGDWNSIALYAPDGDPENIIAMGTDEKPFLPTPILDACEYLKEVLATFECPFQSVRLMRLCAGARILPHTDYKSGYEDGMFRIHIPILTNDRVKFILDGQRIIMKPGECWYTNVNYEHAVINEGEEDRIHLVIDGVRNEWSDKLFFSLAEKSGFFPVNEPQYTTEEKARIIEELERMGTVEAKALIEKLNN